LAAVHISCVIPVFNGAAFLDQALESVFTQTHPAIEIVVVDDGSTDLTPQIVHCYGDSVRYVRQSNAGPSAARNTGIAHSTGDFVAFLDADDRWIPEKTALQVTHFEADADLGICTSFQKNFWEDAQRATQEQASNATLSEPHPGASATLMVRRQIFKEIGVFDPALQHRDTASWLLKARSAGVKTLEIRDVLVHRRLHESNLSRSRGQQDTRELLSLIRAKRNRSESP